MLTGCYYAGWGYEQRDRDPACDLVLQGEQIAHIAVEAVGPQMRTSTGVDELGVDADLLIRPPSTSFRAIPNAQLAADLPRVDWPVPVRESAIA
jgi:hypothetical protein